VRPIRDEIDERVCALLGELLAPWEAARVVTAAALTLPAGALPAERTWTRPFARFVQERGARSGDDADMTSQPSAADLAHRPAGTREAAVVDRVLQLLV